MNYIILCSHIPSTAKSEIPGVQWHYSMILSQRGWIKNGRQEEEREEANWYSSLLL